MADGHSPKWVKNPETYCLLMDSLHPTWWNFLKGVNEIGRSAPAGTSNWFVQRDHMLLQYNAYATSGKVYFKTEQDAMMFLLRWS